MSSRYLIPILIVSIIANLFFGLAYFRQNQKHYFTVTRIVDGDTFATNEGRYIRLLGVDAPESDRCGYQQAKDALSDLILNKQITYAVAALDAYQRPVADVYDTKGESINVAIIATGWAVYDSSDSQDKAAALKANTTARSAKLGVFGSLCSQLVNISHPTCSIKGNVNDSSGTKIYSFPSCVRYEKTVVALYGKDAWFCSEKEALTADFVKSQYCGTKKFSN